MIENIKILPDSLHVKFKNNIDDNFPNIWLRDHAKDDENWDQRSHQRKTFTAKLDTNLFIKEALVSENGNYVNILWSDSEKMIKYSTEFLQKNTFGTIRFLTNDDFYKMNDNDFKKFISSFEEKNILLMGNSEKCINKISNFAENNKRITT